MRHLLPLAALCAALVSVPAAAQTSNPWTESQALTRTAPTASSEGANLSPYRSLRLSVCATSGNTLSGGTLAAYWYDPTDTLWKRNPSLDVTVTATTRCQVFPDFEVGPMGGRVIWATSSVTVSGGTTVTVKILGGVTK